MKKDINISFSIDDVIKSLLWLEKSKTKSIFESYTFDFCKWLYDRYGISITCNCLYSDGINNLSTVSERFREEFEENSDWLKFSFHGWNFEKSYEQSNYHDAFNDISVVNSEIIRICGKKALSNIVRTHFFSGSEEAVEAWIDAGITEILTADDDRTGKGINYNLNDTDIYNLSTKHTILKSGIRFTKTDIRIENIYLKKGKCVYYKDNDEIVIFTHEKYLNEDWMKPTVDELINSLCKETSYD